jgi:hypothetical protein
MTQHAELAVKPEFMIEIGFPAEKILQAAADAVNAGSRS